MTETEAAYVAGLLEGEGCFDFNAGDPRYPRIRCETTDRDVADKLVELVGGRISLSKRRQAHHKQAYMWFLNGRDNVEPVLVAIRPWMSQRRTAKIDELLNSYV